MVCPLKTILCISQNIFKIFMSINWLCHSVDSPCVLLHEFKYFLQNIVGEIWKRILVTFFTVYVSCSVEKHFVALLPPLNGRKVIIEAIEHYTYYKLHLHYYQFSFYSFIQISALPIITYLYNTVLFSVVLFEFKISFFLIYYTGI